MIEEEVKLRKQPKGPRQGIPMHGKTSRNKARQKKIWLGHLWSQ